MDKSKENSVITVTPPKGVKYDKEKPMMRLLPPNALEETAKVLTFGARKYSPENWRFVENATERYIDAAMRHINEHNKGELLDSESSLSHLAHAVCCLMFVIELNIRD